MSLIKNENKNFYPKVVEGTDWHCDYLWSTHRGCPFDCVYCSSKRLNVRFGGDPTEIKRLKGEWYCPENPESVISRKLPSGSIFVNPYTDIMTLTDYYDIQSIFSQCNFDQLYHQNLERECNFIFQTKDPGKYFDYLDWIPDRSWLGTTIEVGLALRLKLAWHYD